MHTFESLEVPENCVGVHWFGQSSFAVKDPVGTIVQIDPYFPQDRPSERFVHSSPPLDEASLRTDHVLLTHDHGDHTCAESLQRIQEAYPNCQFAGPSESVERMRGLGFPDSHLSEVTSGDTLTLSTQKAHAVWAKPPLGVPEEGIDAPPVQHLGYVLQVGFLHLYVSGDPINTFANHDELLTPIAAFNPDIGLLTTHPTEGEFPYFDGSVETALKLGLEAAVPAHYACFVNRNYDPEQWAEGFPEIGPRPIIIPYNEAIVYPS